MWWWFVARAAAGDVYAIEPVSGEFVVVSSSPTEGASIVTWPDRPVELVIVADLSGSVQEVLGAPPVMQEALLATFDAMAERPVPGDRLGVIAFSGEAQRWVPLAARSAAQRDQLAAFGAPLDGHGPRGVPTRQECRDAEPVPGEPPSACAIAEYRGTNVARGLKAALAELRKGDDQALQAIVVLWDGGQTAPAPVARVLDRLWKREVHVWSVGIGDVVGGGLVSRGGGDSWIAPADAPAVLPAIVDQLRFPE